MLKLIIYVIIGIVIGAVLMDYWNYKLAKEGGLTKWGGVFQNKPKVA